MRKALVMDGTVWYHGTDRNLDFLRAGSWVTNVPLEAALFAKLKCSDWRDVVIIRLKNGTVPKIEVSVSEGCHHATLRADAIVDEVWTIDDIANLIDPNLVMPMLRAESYPILR